MKISCLIMTHDVGSLKHPVCVVRVLRSKDMWNGAETPLLEFIHPSLKINTLFLFYLLYLLFSSHWIDEMGCLFKMTKIPRHLQPGIRTGGAIFNGDHSMSPTRYFVFGIKKYL